jgi:hypothetical protein
MLSRVSGRALIRLRMRRDRLYRVEYESMSSSKRKINIVVHFEFTNADPLSDDNFDLVPQFAAWPRVVQSNLTLGFHGCSINRRQEPMKFILRSFVANGVFPQMGSPAVRKSSISSDPTT